jgi:hypothetical protein
MSVSVVPVLFFWSVVSSQIAVRPHTSLLGLGVLLVFVSYFSICRAETCCSAAFVVLLCGVRSRRSCLGVCSRSVALLPLAVGLLRYPSSNWTVCRQIIYPLLCMPSLTMMASSASSLLALLPGCFTNRSILFIPHFHINLSYIYQSTVYSQCFSSSILI